MLNVSYKNPMGYVDVKSYDGKSPTRWWLCRCNTSCWAEIHTTIEKDDDGEKVFTRTLGNWFYDIQHLKNCVKDELDFSRCHYHINLANCKGSINQAAMTCLTKMGAKITLYYKEYKKNVII